MPEQSPRWAESSPQTSGCLLWQTPAFLLVYPVSGACQLISPPPCPAALGREHQRVGNGAAGCTTPEQHPGTPRSPRPGLHTPELHTLVRILCGNNAVHGVLFSSCAALTPLCRTQGSVIATQDSAAGFETAVLRHRTDPQLQPWCGAAGTPYPDQHQQRSPARTGNKK